MSAALLSIVAVCAAATPTFRVYGSVGATRVFPSGTPVIDQVMEDATFDAYHDETSVEFKRERSPGVRTSFDLAVSGWNRAYVRARLDADSDLSRVYDTLLRLGVDSVGVQWSQTTWPGATQLVYGPAVDPSTIIGTAPDVTQTRLRRTVVYWSPNPGVKLGLAHIQLREASMVGLMDDDPSHHSEEYAQFWRADHALVDPDHRIDLWGISTSYNALEQAVSDPRSMEVSYARRLASTGGPFFHFDLETYFGAGQSRASNPALRKARAQTDRIVSSDQPLAFAIGNATAPVGGWVWPVNDARVGIAVGYRVDFLWWFYAIDGDGPAPIARGPNTLVWVEAEPREHRLLHGPQLQLTVGGSR